MYSAGMSSRGLRRALAVGAAAAVAAVALFGAVLYWYAPTNEGPPADLYALGESVQDGDLPVLWPVADFEFTGHRGAKLTPRSLAGQVWIADFIFTRCTSVCPLITARMTALQRRIAHPGLRFVSFSVDPANDTPQALAAYAEKWNPEEERWLLLATRSPEIEQFARQMRVVVAADADPNNPIMHTNLFMLVDGQGRVRGVYNSSDRQAVKRLERDALALLEGAGGGRPATAAAAAEPRTGAELYSALRCAACHDDAKIAPPLEGLRGRTVKLEQGGDIHVDEAYVKRSIVAPGEQIVAGYLPLMPPYGDELTDDELDELVHYLMERGSPAPAAQAAAALIALDPICQMKVRVSDATPYSVHAGETTYFCSELCKKKFDGAR